MHGTVKEMRAEDMALVMRLMHAKARTDFYTFRQVIRPNMKKGWWTKAAADKLQAFEKKMRDGHRPKMVMMAPPQHGKTWMVTDFMAWVLGRNPDLRECYTSYSDRLGHKTNADLQRVMAGAAYQSVFSKTRINSLLNGTRIVGSTYKSNSDQVDIIGTDGGFRNTTVLGQLTGFGFGLGVIDDPIKGRKEARSELVRNNTWDWLTDDFFTRFTDDAGFLMVMTRWHMDDPAGRFLEKFKGEVEVARWPAIAIKDSSTRKKGEALFPEHKSLAFLLEREGLMSKGSWESLYQQNPMVIGGEIFITEKFGLASSIDRKDVISTVRYWDKAGTEDGGAFTCGVRMHKMKDKTFIIDDVKRGQWAYNKREAYIRQCAEVDNAQYSCTTWVEQEPGSGGKESAESTIKNLQGFRAKADKVTGAKEDRCEPYVSSQQNGNVSLLATGQWVRPFIDEHEEYPNGKYKDQIDAAGGAFNKLTLGSTYDSTMGWVR